MANFQTKVCRRSIQAAVDAIGQMNMDVVEALPATLIGVVGFGLLLRAKELAAELAEAAQRLPVEDEGEDDNEVVPADLDEAEEWYSYDDE